MPQAGVVGKGGDVATADLFAPLLYLIIVLEHARSAWLQIPLVEMSPCAFSAHEARIRTVLQAS